MRRLPDLWTRCGPRVLVPKDNREAEKLEEKSAGGTAATPGASDGASRPLDPPATVNTEYIMHMVDRDPTRGSLALHLECLRCGATGAPTGTERVCERCHGPAAEEPGVLDVRYDYPAASRAFKHELARRPSDLSVFRYGPVLPLPRDAGDSVSRVPRTGGTPIRRADSLARRLGLDALWVKDETRNPSGSLKDRATALAVVMAVAQGHRHACCASAGNAARSLAYYCRLMGLTAHVFVPHDIAAARLEALRALGADVRISSGDYDRAYDEATRCCADQGWYDRSCAWNPYLVEGKKTVSYEIAEQLGWKVPEVVAAPVGDGCTLGAIGKGFHELVLLGLTDERPRLLGVQAQAVQPLVRRFQGRPTDSAPEATRASSIAVRRPRNAVRVLEEVRRSGGALLAVPDEATARAQELLLDETGIHAEFSSATALAALLTLKESGSLAARSAALVVTGRA